MSPSRVKFLELALLVALVVACLVGAAFYWYEPGRPTERRSAPHTKVSKEASGEADFERPGNDPPPPKEVSEAQELKERLLRKFNQAHEEFTLMERLRALEFSDPEQSIRLAEDIAQRFPNSIYAPERAWYHARNLVYLERFGEARQLALQTNEQYPDDPRSRDLASHLLSHPFGLPPRSH
jgi:hypothetical protein